MTGDEPSRITPDPALSARFSKQQRQGTRPEMLLRQELHRRGLRFRVQFSVPGLPRRRVDVAFTKVRVAVLVDGCFWHACPQHCVVPRANHEWWLWKFQTNRERDADTDARLASLGWQVVRLWEHEPTNVAAGRVVEVVQAVAPDA